MGFGPLGTSCSPASNSLEAEVDDDGVCVVLLLLVWRFIADDDDDDDGDEADGEE